MSPEIIAALPAAETLRGDLRDLVLGAIRMLAKPWAQLTEAEQKHLAGLVDGHATAIVGRMAVLVATKGQPCVIAKVDRVNVGTTAQAILSLNLPSAQQLIPHSQQLIAVTAIGAEQLVGERAPPATMPDQPPLPIAQPSATAPPPISIQPPAAKEVTEPPAGRGGRKAKATPPAPPAPKKGSPFARGNP